MDIIYNLNSSELIDLKQNFEKLKSALNYKEFPNNDEDIKKLMGFEGKSEEFEKLVETVSLSKLEQLDDVKVVKYIPGVRSNYRNKTVLEIPKKALRLNTFREILRNKGRFSTSVLTQSTTIQKGNALKRQSLNCNTKCNLKPYQDIVITVRVYKPCRYSVGQRNAGLRISEEFEVLGQNMLTELRDKISCDPGNGRMLDISNNPSKLSKTGDEKNPGFFFITDTFYNDTRNPDNPDYSEVIRKWLHERPCFQGIEFKTAKMEETRFIDLQAKLGFPQVYQHQGNCEHVFVLSSVRLISSQDHLHSEDYPLLNSIITRPQRLCHICANRIQSVIVTNSNRHVFDPAYLCKICFQSYHYNNGQKIGDFKAYLVNPNEVISILPDEEQQHCDDDDEYSEDTK